MILHNQIIACCKFVYWSMFASRLDQWSLHWLVIADISSQKCENETEKDRLEILFLSCCYSQIDDLVRMRLSFFMKWILSSAWCFKRWRSYWQCWYTRSSAEHAPIRFLKQLSFCSSELWLDVELDGQSEIVKSLVTSAHSNDIRD